MARVWADRVRETSNTSGTGAITPTGAYDASFVTFASVLSPGDTCSAGVKDGAGNWNTFLGTWNGTTLARTSIYAGSDGLNPVNLSGSDVEVWLDAPADWIGTRVDAAEAADAAPVQSVAGRTGDVVLAAGDISGLAASATTDTTNASNISSGTLDSARLPAGIGTVTNIATAGLATGGPITTTGTITVAAPSAGVVYSDGSALSATTIGGGLQLTSSTLQAQMPRTTQTGNYTLAASDRASVVAFTGSSASTITLPSAATVGSGWWCILKHEGTGTTAAAKKLAISGTLDGVSDPAVYPGDTRIIQSDGSNLVSVLLAGGYVEILNSDSAFTLTLPSGDTWHEFEAWGGGGGGGSGRRGAAGGIRAGGSAGGGGAYNTIRLRTADIGATSLTVTVAGTAAGGAAVAVDTTNGNNGTAGGDTTFGSILTGFGGGRGFGGLSANNAGGTGGGATGAGASGGASSGIGGGANSAGLAGAFFGAGSVAGQPGQTGGWGAGAGGGTASTTTAGAGGCAIRGGRGGGAGGAIDAANTARAGGAGGSGTGGNGGGGAGGAATGGAGTAGTAGPTNQGPGTGGGGGGAGAGAGGAGADGGIACGGGGGAASVNGNNSGAGGAGGAGLARYRYGP